MSRPTSRDTSGTWYAASTFLLAFVPLAGFRLTHRLSQWSMSELGFVWYMGLSFCFSGVGTSAALLFLLPMNAYINQVMRLAKPGIKWGT